MRARLCWQGFVVQDKVWHEFAVIESNEAICGVEIAVVMSDDQSGFATRLEFGQELGIENLLEMRVLVGSPFIEKVERPVLKVGGKERKAFTLSLRDGERRESAVPNFYLMMEMELLEVSACLVFQKPAFCAEKVLEKEEVCENS
jgi:hypothetical protein